MIGDILQEQLREAVWRYTFGLDTCKDREVLREMGGPRYWHLEKCGCDSVYGFPPSGLPFADY